MSTNAFPWQPGPTTAMAETACVNFGGDLHLYARGHREGAEALFELVAKHGYPQDLLVYPIVFGLRHSAEVLLKQVIREGRRLLGDPGDFPDDHRLNVLWNTGKPILQRIWSGDPALRTVETTISKLCALDPEGESFRYPVTTRKKRTGGRRAPTLDPALSFIDLGALVAEVTAALDLLDGADTGIDAYLQLQHDAEEEKRYIEAEMRAALAADLGGAI